MRLQITAPSQPVTASIALPLSKSISNRALVIAALCDGQPQVLHPALCDDTAVMIEALSHDGGEINVGASGTAMRFLTAYFATREGTTVTLDGVERMRQRPIGPLVDALRELGADILPVFLHGVGHVLPKEELMFRRGDIHIEIGERIRPYENVQADTESECDRAVTKQMRHFYQDHYAEICQELETPEYWRHFRRYQDRYKIPLVNS